MKKTCAYLIIAHGSRDEESNREFFGLVERFREAYPDRDARGAFLEIARPGIPEGIEACIEAGARELFILPLMFFRGRHVKKDIPGFIQEAKMKHPEVDFHYAGPLGDDPELVKLIHHRAEQVARRPG